MRPTSWTEAELSERFLEHGHVVLPVEDQGALERIRDRTAVLAAEHLGLADVGEVPDFLNAIGAACGPDRLNDLRLAVISGLIQAQWFRVAYYSLAARALSCLVGNELAMQRSIGFSIQLPDDDSSLLPVNSDVWSENSPYEVVLWVPLVDCSGTKSMYFLPPRADLRWRDRVAEFAEQGPDALFAAIEPDLQWINVPFGSFLLFSHTYMHGNRVNTEGEARWSFNLRFKSLFSPYADKRLGDYFVPLQIRPATRIGMGYQLPGGFGQ